LDKERGEELDNGGGGIPAELMQRKVRHREGMGNSFGEAEKHGVGVQAARAFKGKGDSHGCGYILLMQNSATKMKGGRKKRE